MALRLVEIFLPLETEAKLFEILSAFPPATIVQRENEEGQLHLKVLVKSDQTEELLDQLEAAFHHRQEYRDKFRILITPVQATIPRIEQAGLVEQETTTHKIKYARVNREELYANVLEAGKLTWSFVLMVTFSSIVAVIGYIFKCNSSCSEIMSRTEVNELDIILALITGCIATLSFTMAMAGTLIGVMVAVALMPPLVSSGILLGSGQFRLAVAAGLLFLTNLICVNLSGVVTFLIQGVQPLWWWEKEKAKRAKRHAVIVWIICLLLLILTVFSSRWWNT